MYHTPIFFDCRDLVLRYKARNKDVILRWSSVGKLPAFEKCAYKGMPLWRISEIKEWEAKHAGDLKAFRKLVRVPPRMFLKKSLLANSEGINE